MLDIHCDTIDNLCTAKILGNPSVRQPLAHCICWPTAQQRRSFRPRLAGLVPTFVDVGPKDHIPDHGADLVAAGPLLPPADCRPIKDEVSDHLRMI